jgi:hypothetical protein
MMERAEPRALIYECRDSDVPAHRRFIAQFTIHSLNRYIVVHGATPALARAKLEVLREYMGLDALARSKFDLKGKLAVLNGGEDVARPTARLSTFEDLLG